MPTALGKSWALPTTDGPVSPGSIVRIWIAAGGVWHQAGLIAGLQELGHGVTNIGPVEIGDCSQVKIGSRALREAATALRNGDLFWFQWFGRRFADHLARSANEVDLVIGWSSFMHEALQKPAPPIVLVRGSHHIETQADLLGRYGPSSALVAREVEEYQRALAVTVPTHQIAMDHRWLAERRPVVRVIASPYGFPSAATEARIAPPSPPRVAIVGEVGYRKGIDRVIDSLEGLSVVVNVVGKRSRAERRRWRLPADWHVHGQVGRGEVQRISVTSHMLLSLSREEGMQRAGQEAMAVGTPVIATKETGLSWWLDAGADIELPGSTSRKQWGELSKISSSLGRTIQGRPSKLHPRGLGDSMPSFSSQRRELTGAVDGVRAQDRDHDARSLRTRFPTTSMTWPTGWMSSSGTRLTDEFR